MESYRGQEEFEEQLLKDVKSFVEKNFKNAEFQKKDELEQSFDKIFFRTLKTHRLLTEISDITGIKGENVEILARSILSDVEVVDAIKQLGTVHRIRIKKHYKYQSVRADISLLEGYEQSFLKGVWKEKVLIGSNEKNKKVIEMRWFHGDKTVSEIKSKCMWKAYKVIHMNYYQDVARKNYTFEYGKMTRFGKKTVFLAYFKSRQQLEDAIASDANEENKWMIHGRRLDNVLRNTLKPSGLVSTIPNKNVDTTKSVSKIEEKSTTTPSIVGETITTTEEEVVGVVNKYRRDCLDDKYRGYFKDQATWDQVKNKYKCGKCGKCQAGKEEQASGRLPSLQNYATPKDVVKVIKEYREETSVMSGPVIVEEAILVDLSDPKEVNVEMDKEEERIKVPESKESKEKIVLPVELYEYTKVNADCAKRLQNESDLSIKLAKRNPGVAKGTSSLCLPHRQVKKIILKKSRSV
ncbi:hypothetical protein RhiirA4_481547 [Rhizophagus irregularis]|uniref:Uncharacterized protein n=1 Tax=Rhizophagus irregularis TaxID=588596 RepID=A0A2I1HJN8_9GLOM|nr:hypothetical protein RhiirA4_481547 [Rhizophagus irregularis]